jgi:hypothetical protein
MSDLARRLAALFLAPPQDAGGPAREERPAALPRPAQLVAVLAPAPVLAAAAGGVACGLRREAGARTAVVCRPGAAVRGATAAPAARRVARRLVDRGVEAAASGLLCHVALEDDPVDATRRLWRVAGAVDVPVVLALPGRLDGYDGVLAQLDRLVLATPPGAEATVTTLALASLERLGPPVVSLGVPAGLIARRAAALGLVAIDRPRPGDEPAAGAPVEPSRAEALA